MALNPRPRPHRRLSEPQQRLQPRVQPRLRPGPPPVRRSGRRSWCRPWTEEPHPDGGRVRPPRPDWRDHQPGPRVASSLQAGGSETGRRWRAVRPSSLRTAESSRLVSSLLLVSSSFSLLQDKSSALRYANSSGGPVQYLSDPTLPPGWKCQKKQNSIYYTSPMGEK